MNMKIVGITVAILVSITVLAGVLMPVLDDATTVNDTFTNEGLWRMKEIQNGDAWTRTSDTWAYGDTAIALPTGQSGSNVMLGDDWCIRYIGHLRSSASTVNKSTNLNNAIVTAGEELIVASKTDSTWTANLDYPGYGADPNGNFIMTAFGSSSYVNGDTQIYGTGVSTIQDMQVFVHVTGTVEDGATFTVTQSTGQDAISDVVITNAKVNYTEVDDHKDLYLLSSITCDISYNATIDGVSTPQSGSISFSSYVIPYEVTAERAVHFTDNQNALFAVIPMLVIVAILIGVVALVIRSRLD